MTRPTKRTASRAGEGAGPSEAARHRVRSRYPGTYTVSMDVGGETFSSTVEIQADPRRPMTMSDRMARQDALMSLHRLAVPINDATAAISHLEEQLDAAEELIAGADAPPEGIEEELEAIREALEEIEDEVSEARQNAGVARAIQQAFGPPDRGSHVAGRPRLEVMGETVLELNALIEDRVPALNAQLYAEGVRPDAGEAVEMPER